MWIISQATGLISHRIEAVKPEEVHSPYLFELLPAVHDEDRYYYFFDEIEAVRAQLMHSTGNVPVEDLGAGSRVLSPNGHRKISQVARTAVSKPKRCRMVARLLHLTNAKTVLELGTNLGIMTTYLASGDTSRRVHTIEGNPALVDLAVQSADIIGLNNITFHRGDFNNILPVVLQSVPEVDFAMIDGDHRGDSLLHYWQLIRPKLSTHAIVLLDDIRWSQDMYTAWQEIWRDESIPCVLDYFGFGLLFLGQQFMDLVRLKIR